MFKENLLDKILGFIRSRLIPKSVFSFFQPLYHTLLAYIGALMYGFPSRSMKVIGVTGTKGKSTVVFVTAKILEELGYSVASVGSLGFKIKNKEWANNLKMTMPGRFKLQSFLRQAKNAGCEFVVMEVTSEGIAQKRHLGIKFDSAVFLNIHPEHIENHGSFENYLSAKQELFKVTKNTHIINADDSHLQDFSKFKSYKKIFFGKNEADVRFKISKSDASGSEFEIYGTNFKTSLAGEFNVYNCVASIATAIGYGAELPAMESTISKIDSIPGRMNFIQRDPFMVVVDYAHTPDSLKGVYKAMRSYSSGKLICVLGAAGGGRDKWKRPEFGRIADGFCDKIFLTDEDPYEESPDRILDEIEAGISETQKITRILSREEAIKSAIQSAEPGDGVIITGKGSENSMAVKGGKKISWSDMEVVKKYLIK